METKKGQVAVTTENIFPIIRQWLYQDRDIFLRELASNAADALAKYKRLVQMGELPADEDELRIDITLDTEQGTLSIRDNGIGMTGAEIEKYINQIAYSGMVDFVERYKEEGADGAAFIGHFGLGFYSAFMVAEPVRIDSLSCQGGPATYWQSEDGIDFEMGPSSQEGRGTVITLTLNEEAKADLTAGKVRQILNEYCRFMAFPIYFQVVGEEPPASPLNDTEPLWRRPAREITDDEYKAFYRSLFGGGRDPLFWIHLNLDYPFRLQGILYFPRTDNVYDVLEGRIKVFYNQVFVADNIKEILPDFLFLLQGALDAPDLPLNVSRSFLQNDTYVKKLAGHIIRKVADKLKEIEKSDRALYASYWKDIAVFVKYGMMREELFFEKAEPALLFETTQGEFLTLAELPEETVDYTPGRGELEAYVSLVERQGRPVVIMDQEIDNQFMSFLEYHQAGKRRFQRVDAVLAAGGEASEAEQEALTTLFREVSGREDLSLRLAALGDEAPPALIEQSEERRRFEEMRQQFARMGLEELPDEAYPGADTLVLNSDRPLAGQLAALAGSKPDDEETKRTARHLYDLARLGQGSLTGEDLLLFLERSATYAEEALS